MRHNCARPYASRPLANRPPHCNPLHCGALRARAVRGWALRGARGRGGGGGGNCRRADRVPASKGTRKRSVRGHARSWSGHARAIRHTLERCARRVEDTCGGRACRAGRSAHSADRPVDTGKGGLSTEREQGRVRSDSTPGQAIGHACRWRFDARLLARFAPLSHLSIAGGVPRERSLT